jgi:hypothetical protein
LRDTNTFDRWLCFWASILMWRKMLLAGVALAALGAWKHGTSTGGGGAVTPIAIDGGPTYYATNGFTVATTSRIYNGVTYSTGLDSPGWFPIGPFLVTYQNQTPDADRWNNLGLNTSVVPDSNNAFMGQLALFATNGVSVIQSWQHLAAQISRDTTPGNETSIITLYDEPWMNQLSIAAMVTGLPQVNFTGTVTSGNVLAASALSSNNLISQCDAACWGQPIITGGSPALPANTYLVQNGATSGAGNYVISTSSTASGSMSQAVVTPLTMAIINGRPLYTNFTNAIYSNNSPSLGLGGGPPYEPNNVPSAIGTTLSTNHLAVDGTTNRHIDISGIDFYWFAQAYSANGTFGGNNWNLTGTFIYDTTHAGPNMSVADMAKGSHHGDVVDFMRAIQTANGQLAPIFDNIETGNAFLGIPYETQPQEINWSMWSHVIHGGRGIALFTHDNGWFNGAPGSNGNDNLQSTQSATILTAAANATASAGTLAVTSVSAGFIAPGMVSTSGISGQIQILQQTSNFTAGSGNIAANYAYAVLSGAGTGGPGTMTFAQPVIAPNVTKTVSVNGATASGAVLNFASTTGIFPGMGVADLTAPSVIPAQTSVLSKTATTVTMSASVTGAGIGATDSMQFSVAGTILAGLQSTNALISTLAKVINSPFAKGYATTNNTGYAFELGMAQACGNLQTLTCGTNTGIEYMVKNYAGGTYSTSGYNINTDSITNGFYIFATTRNKETTVNSSVTFTVPSVSAVAVINESRSITPSGATFTDTFANAWTVHIYKVTP